MCLNLLYSQNTVGRALLHTAFTYLTARDTESNKQSQYGCARKKLYKIEIIFVIKVLGVYKNKNEIFLQILSEKYIDMRTEFT